MSREKNNWFRPYPTGYESRRAIFNLQYTRPGDRQSFPPNGTRVELLQTANDIRGQLVRIRYQKERVGYVVTECVWTDARNLTPTNSLEHENWIELQCGH